MSLYDTRMTRIALISLAVTAPFFLPTTAVAQQMGVASAEQAAVLDQVEVLGYRRPLASFPGAIDVISGDALRAGQRRVNLSESLVRVPGVSVLDRQNYAQDLQVQSRGFGARSTFGIRGIKLVVDGIPASSADGQGQAATFPLASLDRIEVLRGPLALQYGNAAGGAIVGRSELGDEDSVALDAWTGSDATRRLGARIESANNAGSLRGRLSASDFATAGSRPHSAARRSQLDAAVQWTPGTRDTVRVTANVLRQPWTDDPLGLTRAGLRRDPQGTDPVAIQFNTRKRVDNRQVGVRWDHAASDARAWWINAYGVARGIDQFLAVPVAAQNAPTSSGGEIDLARATFGMEVGHRWQGTRGALAVGVEAIDLDETRRGYANFVGTTLGVRGRLRRDERNQVSTRDAWAIGDLRLDAWTLLAGARHSRLSFASDDRFVAPGNGDDSGRVRFDETSVSAGIARAFAAGELFAAIGRGFETPTVTELAYRPDGGAGFNRQLTPARLVSGELGTRLRAGAQAFSATAYRIEGENEIVPAESRGGRASFANAGRTRRDGVEVGLRGALGAQWRYTVAANWIDARFRESFDFRVAAGGPPVTRRVVAGSRIPGIARADGFAEVEWTDASSRWTAALELRAAAPITVDDRNSDATSGNARIALRAQWRAASSGWHAFARVDNILDRDHVGSVIVNEANGRYFEPGAGRTWTLGLGWRAAR